MRIAVTGGAGFVGRHIVARLRDESLDVVSLGRGNGPDLGTAQPQDWAEALKGCDVCIHVAAALPTNKNADFAAVDFDRINVGGTRTLAQGFHQSGGRYFVFLSSIGVHGLLPPSGTIRASDPIAPVNPYTASKYAAEQALAEIPIPQLILRAPAIYGAGASGMIPRLTGAVIKGRLIPVSKHARRDFLGVRNLANLIAHATQTRLTGTYLCSDRAPLDTAAFVDLIAEATECPAKTLNIPTGLAFIATKIPKIGPLVARLTRPALIDDTPLQQASAWQPPFTPAEEIADMIAAIQNQNHKN